MKISGTAGTASVGVALSLANENHGLSLELPGPVPFLQHRGFSPSDKAGDRFWQIKRM
jgi:hypothetical protein